jgi:hypothetical protein
MPTTESWQQAANEGQDVKRLTLEAVPYAPWAIPFDHEGRATGISS